MTDSLTLSLDVECSPEHAFYVWTTRIDMWWPRDHTFTGNAELIVLQAGVGGRIYERTADGVEPDWGEVTRWDPPAHWGYRWHLGAEKVRATEVKVNFVARGDSTTRIEIEHRGWEQFESAAEEWRTEIVGDGIRCCHSSRLRSRTGNEMTSGTKEDPWVLKTAGDLGVHHVQR